MAVSDRLGQSVRTRLHATTRDIALPAIWQSCNQASGGNNYEAKNMRQYALPEKAPDATGQLYNLEKDPGETNNLYFKEETRRKELQALLAKLKSSGRSAPKNRRPFRKALPK